MTTTKFILHGGFTRKINEQNNTFFQEMVKGIENPKVLMCFFAVVEQNRVEELFTELPKRIKDLNPDKEIECTLATQDNFITQLKTADVLYVHGGNTEQLMETLQLFPTFRDEIAGKVVVGSSAGAYVLVAKGVVHTSEHSRAGLGFIPVRLIAHYSSPELPPNENSVKELLASDAEYELVKLRDCEWQVFEINNTSFAINKTNQLLHSSTPFHGVKIAIKNEEGKLLLHLRDNKPGLFNANMWDFGGGGREGEETPFVCIQREVKEEFAIDITESDIRWVGLFQAQKDPTQKAVFCVAEISDEQKHKIVLGEGQKYEFMTEADFFNDPQVIHALKERYQFYLDTV
jgi:8-oxo-dGTP diphosphatase